jgi:hypothetical protein
MGAVTEVTVVARGPSQNRSFVRRLLACASGMPEMAEALRSLGPRPDWPNWGRARMMASRQLRASRVGDAGRTSSRVPCLHDGCRRHIRSRSGDDQWDNDAVRWLLTDPGIEHWAGTPATNKGFAPV